MIPFLKKHWRALAPLALFIGILPLMASSCTSQTANGVEAKQVSTQQDLYTKNQPVPTYQYSNERAEIIQLYNQRIRGNLDTWTVWYSNSGVALGTCPSKGYPLPYGTELTNPQQITQQYFDPNGSGNEGAGYSTGIVGQMDPNGLYPTANSLGTWIMCLDNAGTVHPVYMEPLVATYPYPVKIVNGAVVQAGDANANSAITLGGK